MAAAHVELIVRIHAPGTKSVIGQAVGEVRPRRGLDLLAADHDGRRRHLLRVDGRRRFRRLSPSAHLAQGELKVQHRGAPARRHHHLSLRRSESGRASR